MLDLNDLRVFVKVVESENLTVAGNALDMQRSTVSRKISRLESHLGVKLLHRSTRSVTITDDGQIFYEYSVRCLGILNDGQRAVQSKQIAPQGVIKLALPYMFEPEQTGPLISEFLQKYPDVHMLNVLTNNPIESLNNGFDLAISVGPLKDSTHIATKLGDADFGLYASPFYLERTGMPQSHLDLARFDLLSAGIVDREQTWVLKQGEQHFTVAFKPRLICNNYMLLRHSVLSGLGIANLPSFVCKHDLANGRMVEVLPGSQTLSMSFYAVFPNYKVMPARIRALIDFFVLKLREEFSWRV